MDDSAHRICRSRRLTHRRAMLEAKAAWCTDHHYIYIDVNGNGLLPVEAENQG